MNLDVQFKLNQSPNYITYLRYNTHWYKILMRNPEKINDFIKEFKEFNRIQKQEKLKRTLEYIEFFQSVMSKV